MADRAYARPQAGHTFPMLWLNDIRSKDTLCNHMLFLPEDKELGIFVQNNSFLDK